MLQKILLLSLIILKCLFCSAQSASFFADRKLIHHVHIGYNFGGLSPVPLPNTIRKINSYSPGASPSLGYGIRYKLRKGWSLGAAARLDWKGMQIGDSVQYFHTLISQGGSDFEGDFTGTNNTQCRNLYVTVPVSIFYSKHDNWRFGLGVFAAQLIRPYFRGTVSNGYIRKGNSLGEKVIIERATFDFDTTQRTFDYGVQGGIEKRFLQQFYVTGNLQWGLRPVYPPSFKGIGFKMYNIFFTLGLKMEL